MSVLAHLCVLLSFILSTVWGQDWSGQITIASDPTAGSNNGKPLSVNAYIPDTSKPIRAALIMGWAYDDRDWRTVAAEYNCLMIETTLNYYDATTAGKKIVAILNRASVQFPAHPEIQYTCVTVHGWSQASAGAALTASQPELANRVLALVGIHEIDGAPYQAPLSVPHLFLSGWPDGYSALLGGYQGQARTLARAAAGAPITMVNDVGHDHTDVTGNYAFTRVWLEEVFKRRLPAVPPTTTNIVLPDWTNDPNGWRGAYDVVENTNTAPWGNAQRLTNVVIASRAAYSDSRQPIWFPSQWCAQVWQVYSTTGRMPTYGTLTTPTPTLPVFTVQPQNTTVVAGQPACIWVETTATPPAIYRWHRVTSAGDTVVSTSPRYFTWGPTGTDFGATYYVVATNEAGSTTSPQVTLNLSTTTAAPMFLVASEIVGQPMDKTEEVGDTATFSVWAQGTPAPTYQWKRNGANITGATQASYTTPALVAGDNGATFQVVLTNSAGTATSRSARLTVGISTTAPVITTQPLSRTVTVGATATFTVAATGNPAPTFQWRKGGVNIAGATSASYTTPATVLADSGALFSVVATNSAGSATSGNATLSVQAAPVITTQPLSRTVTAGATATFTVVATGSPTPTFQWRKGGVNIAGATGASYTTPATILADSGALFNVVATNSAGNATSGNAILSVQAVVSAAIFADDDSAITGGSRILGVYSSSQGANPFASASGSYIHASVPAGAAGRPPLATYTPTSAANSWNALVGTLSVHGTSYLTLNGGFDVFVRPLSPTTLTNMSWFRPVDVVYGGNLRIILCGCGSNNLQLEIKTQAPAGLGSAPGSFTSNDSWTLPGALGWISSPIFTIGATTHVGLTFSTNVATGQITARVFGVPGTGAIDTGSTAMLLATQSFYASATAIGPNPLPTGAWSPQTVPSTTTVINVDYDAIRLYNTTPGAFPALPGISAPAQPSASG